MVQRLMRWFPGLMLLVLVAACRGEPSVPPGDLVPMLALPTLGGDLFDPSGLRGMKVVVSVWSPG